MQDTLTAGAALPEHATAIKITFTHNGGIASAHPTASGIIMLRRANIRIRLQQHQIAQFPQFRPNFSLAAQCHCEWSTLTIAAHNVTGIAVFLSLPIKFPESIS